MRNLPKDWGRKNDNKQISKGIEGGYGAEKRISAGDWSGNPELVVPFHCADLGRDFSHGAIRQDDVLSGPVE